MEIQITFFEHYQGIMIAVVIVVFCIITKRVMKLFSEKSLLQFNRMSRSHTWVINENLQALCRCSKCDILLTEGEGYSCSCCGLSCDIACLPLLEQCLPCKKITILQDSEPIKHHWVKVGNLFTESNSDYTCDHCGGSYDFEEAREIQCCWCQRILHSDCENAFTPICDFGEFRRYIIPPANVELMKRNRYSGKLILKTVTDPVWEDWTPVIVIANCQAGNSDGLKILSYFRRILNPCQVIDLNTDSIDVVKNWCKVMTTKFRILVAGGDGTISWIFNIIHDADIQCAPYVGIIPLGTGNDLSRSFGWGPEYDTSVLPSIYLRSLDSCTEQHLDRWKFISQPFYRSQKLRHPRAYKTLDFYNYFSVGVDAKVALDFHRTRQSSFLYIFKNRIFNKILYLCFGTQQAMDPVCKGLENIIELNLDGRHISLPEIESVVILNISSWASGVDLWKMGEDDVPSQRTDDGKLEVVAIYSSFHIAQLQMGLSHPHRIGQASCIKIKVKQPMAVQADGEPWIQHPGEIVIKYDEQATILKRRGI